MGEVATSAVTISHSSSSSSAPGRSSLRFLGLLNPPGQIPYSNPHFNSSLELDESDVVWSSSEEDRSSPVPTSSPVLTFSPAPSQRPYIPAKFGLSALLESSNSTGEGATWRQSSPVHPPVAVPISISSSPVRKLYNQSAPMAVPVWPAWRKDRGVEPVDEIWGLEEEEKGNGDDEFEGIVPPHVIVARSHVSSFSVLEGVGRTLKGRDLRRVRNAVLQKTGFLDDL